MRELTPAWRANVWITPTDIGSEFEKLALAAKSMEEFNMTRTTNARIAGFTYLFYAAIGICGDLLMHKVFGGGGDAATVARFGE